MDLNILSLASALASHASARQRVIAENVANADTPGFRGRDVVDFAEVLDGGAGFEARRTRAGHLGFAREAGGFEVREQAAMGAETPNGNSVSLEDQMMRAAAVRQEHELAIGVYAKSLEILRTAVAKR